MTRIQVLRQHFLVHLLCLRAAGDLLDAAALAALAAGGHPPFVALPGIALAARRQRVHLPGAARRALHG